MSTWRGTTTEERVGPRRERLLQAGFELLGEHGAEGTSVRGVYTRAGLSPRYFYESFEDLDALIGAIYDEIMEEAWRRSGKAIAAAPDSAEAKTRAGLEAGIGYVAEDARRIQIVYREGGGVLARRRAAFLRRTGATIAGFAATYYGIDADDKLLTSATYMLAGGLGELLVAWQNGSVDLTIDELVDHATVLIVGLNRVAGKAAAEGSAG